MTGNFGGRLPPGPETTYAPKMVTMTSASPPQTIHSIVRVGLFMIGLAMAPPLDRTRISSSPSGTGSWTRSPALNSSSRIVRLDVLQEAGLFQQREERIRTE